MRGMQRGARISLSHVAAGVIESGWLAALVLVPLYFNSHSARPFDEGKVALLRSIAVVMLAALAMWSLGAWHGTDRPLWRIPLVKPVLALSAAYGLSTIFSIAPRVSFWGAYVRAQGVYTWLSFVTIFLAILLLLRRRLQVERIVTAVLLASFPVAVYGLLQRLGWDPFVWDPGGDRRGRITSSAGNAIFLSGYLIMVVPLTLARLLEAAGAPAALAAQRARRAAAYGLLFLLQLLALLFAQSRGPFLGLAVGLTVFALLVAGQYHKQWLIWALRGGAVAGVLFLIVFNLPRSPLAGLRQLPYVGDLGNLLQTEGGTAKVRTVIWEGVVDLLAADPLRDIVGYGPDTMPLAYEPFYPAELPHYQHSDVTPDRAHNETFDALITTGVIGCAAELILFVAVFFHLLRWLGLIATPRQGRAFIGIILAGGGCGVIVPCLVDDSLRFSGVGVATGITLALVVYVMARASTTAGRDVAAARPDRLLLAALLAAIVASFFESQVGIAVVTTRLYCMAFAAVAVAVGMGFTGGAGAQVSVNSPQPHAATGGLVSGAVMGLTLIVLTFEFATPRGFPTFLLFLALSTWLFGMLMTTNDAVRCGDRALRSSAAYAMTSLALWAPYAAVHIPWTRAASTSDRLPVEQLVRLGMLLASSLPILYTFVILAIGVTTLIVVRDDAPAWSAPSHSALWHLALLPLLLIAVVALIAVTNLSAMRADVLRKLGSVYEGGGRLDAAAALYEAAIPLQPSEETYVIDLGRVRTEQARRAPRDAPVARAAYLAQALAAMQQAQRHSPLNPYVTPNLARVQRLSGDTRRESRRARAAFRAGRSQLSRGSGAQPAQRRVVERVGDVVYRRGRSRPDVGHAGARPAGRPAQHGSLPPARRDPPRGGRESGGVGRLRPRAAARSAVRRPVERQGARARPPRPCRRRHCRQPRRREAGAARPDHPPQSRVTLPADTPARPGRGGGTDGARSGRARRPARLAAVHR